MISGEDNRVTKFGVRTTRDLPFSAPPPLLLQSAQGRSRLNSTKLLLNLTLILSSLLPCYRKNYLGAFIDEPFHLDLYRFANFRCRATITKNARWFLFLDTATITEDAKCLS